MLSDTEIQDGSAADIRLVNDKLTGSDVDDLVSAFRSVLGTLETKYSRFNDMSGDLESLDDSVNTRKLARKMAAYLLRLKNEDFGVATIQSTILNSDEEQRKLFIVSALGLLYEIPDELAYLDPISRASNKKLYSSSTRIRTVL